MIIRSRIRNCLFAAALVLLGASARSATAATPSALQPLFGPVQNDLESQRQAAIAAAQLGLDAMSDEALLLVSPLPSLLPPPESLGLQAIELGNQFDLSLSDLSLAADRQALLLRFSFALRHRTTGITLSGNLEAAAVFLVALVPDGIELRITPGITRWTLASPQPGSSGVALPPAAVKAALDFARSKIEERFGPIVLPALIPAASQQIDLPGPNGERFAFHTPAFEIQSVAVLLDGSSLQVLVGVTKKPAAAATRAVGTVSFETVRAHFGETTRRLFGAPPATAGLPEARVSRALVESLSEGLPQGVHVQDRVQDSIDANLKALATLPPTRVAGLTLPASRLEQEVLVLGQGAAQEAVAGTTGGRLEDLEVHFGEQKIEISAALREISIADGITASGRFRGIAAPQPSSGAIRMALAFERIELDSIWLKGWRVDPVKIALGLTLTESNLLPLLNSLLPPVEIELPRVAGKDVELAVPAGAPRIHLEPSRLATPGLAFGTAAVLIDPKGIRALVEIQSNVFPAGEPAPEAMSASSTRFAGYQVLFDQAWRNAFGADPPTGEAALRVPRERIAEFVNGSWPLGGLAAAIDFDELTPLAEQNHRIGQVDTSFNCDRTRECRRDRCERGSCSRHACSRRNCSRAPGECNFDCLRCIDLPFNGRICSDDPGCVGQRTLCNIAAEGRVATCNAQAESEKAACDLREETELAACNSREEIALAACNAREELAVLDCNRLAEQEVAACNLKREAAQSLANLGEIGSTGGQIRAKGSASVAFRELKVAADLRSANIAGAASAAATLEAEVDFVPKGVLGTVVGCVAPVRLRPVTAAIMSSSFSPLLKISDGASAGKSFLRIEVPEVRAAGLMTPAPIVALFRSNPEMRVVCPVITSIAELAPLLGQGLTVLTGDQVAETARDASDLEKALNEARGFLLQYGAGIAHVKLEPLTFELPLPEIEMELPSGKAALTGHFEPSSVSYVLPPASPRP